MMKRATLFSLLASLCLFLSPALAGEAPQEISFAFESKDQLKLWYIGAEHQCDDIPSFNTVQKCEQHVPKQVVLAIPAELAGSSENWLGEGSGNILDIIPPSLTLRLIVYHPTTGSILSRSAPIRGDNRQAYVERQLDPARHLANRHVVPHSGRQLLGHLSSALTSARLTDKNTTVILVGDWSDLNVRVGSGVPAALKALPKAHYTLINPFSKTCSSKPDSGPVPGIERRNGVGSMAFVTCGVTSADARKLIFERLEATSLKSGQLAVSNTPYKEVKSHKKKRRGCKMKRKKCGKKKRVTFKRMLIIFWYSVGFFALLYLWLRIRQRPEGRGRGGEGRGQDDSADSDESGEDS